MAKKYNPKTCGNSTNFGGVYICNMSVSPCKVIYNEGECVEEAMDKWENCLKELIKKEADDE